MIGTLLLPLSFAAVRVSEVRIDSLPPLLDVQYVELSGIAGEHADLWLVVIGDQWHNPPAWVDSGVVRAVVRVDAAIPADRALLVGASPLMLEQPDIAAAMPLGSQHNHTVLLLPSEPWFGVGDDIDSDDDGEPDAPLGAVDSVAFLWQPPWPEGIGGHVYSPTVVGPDGGAVVWGAWLCLDSLAWRQVGMHYPDPLASPGTIGDPCAVTCPGDLDGDLTVGMGDLSTLLGDWGSADGPCDLDRDGIVGSGDLAAVLAVWGSSCVE